MKHRSILLAISLLIAFITSVQAQETKVITGATLIDGTGRSLRVRDDTKRRERPCDLLAQQR